MESEDVPENSRVLRLADAANTYDRALAVVRKKGYHLFFYPGADEEGGGDTYWAIKDKRDFIASDPLGLLGLITMWEHFGDEWQAHDVPRLYNELIDVAYPEDDYAHLTDKEFAGVVEHLRPFFEALWEPLPAMVSRGELAHIMHTYYRSKA